MGLPSNPALGQVGGGRLTAGKIAQPLGSIKNCFGSVAESELGSTKLRRSLNDGFWIGGHGAAAGCVAYFSNRNGRMVSPKLPAAAMSTPMSYQIDGKQYIAVVAGGHDQLDMKRGDYLLVYSLSP